MDLYYELVSCSYQPGRSIMFVVTRPKPREIWAADFRDRIVHHVLYNRYAHYFYRRFIHDSYACIPEKGTLRAANRVQHFIRVATLNHTKPAWFLKADIANFFVSINKQILDELLMTHIKHPWWIWLTRLILHKDPRENVYIKSDKKLLTQIPPHKSLLTAPEGHGLPIGNLSSQFFANVYLDQLDQHVKHILKLNYYVRYVDDIVIINQDNDQLNNAYKRMDKFIFENLELNFHPNKKEINFVKVGINFVGYIIKPWCKYIRRSTINRMHKQIENKNNFKSLEATVNSYFGILKHTNSYNERKNVCLKLNIKGYRTNSKFTKLINIGD